MRPSEEFSRWDEMEGKIHPQAEFARFLEENSVDIGFPEAGTMIEISRDLSTVGQVFGSARAKGFRGGRRGRRGCSFRGGAHSMLALYHMAGGTPAADPVGESCHAAKSHSFSDDAGRHLARAVFQPHRPAGQPRPAGAGPGRLAGSTGWTCWRPYQWMNALTPDKKKLLFYQFSPAPAVGIVDLEGKKFDRMVDVPDCYHIFPASPTVEANPVSCWPIAPRRRNIERCERCSAPWPTSSRPLVGLNPPGAPPVRRKAMKSSADGCSRKSPATSFTTGKIHSSSS
ncbi:amine dehydrogenase large subunit [Paracoccus mutanolyticus]|uniref:amine dehydrogenase large subunit n=1 Tax=Paracoccus mutanolyticus TaxID=1499308 RepID=UPI0021D5383F|nr:amine dehydrogenase large subunit [Paracoccus mutanolyticus]